MAHVTNNSEQVTLEILVTGQVQGVGFRPFIYRIATQYQLKGWVKNCSGEVIIQVQGTASHLESFQQAILLQHPPLATPTIGSVSLLQKQKYQHKQLTDFFIEKSTRSKNAQRHIPADFFTCDDCLEEISNPKERRYRYPFINCTQCGPRYTIIKDLPYDRPNTSLSDFPLCRNCFHEYSEPLDRRFHAQPLACAECGPELSFYSVSSRKNETITHGNESSLSNAVDALKQGKILALKGIGGYHLMCDASNEQAIQRLRKRKQRPDKPLAILFSTAKQLRHYCIPAAGDSISPGSVSPEIKALTSPQRPIVLIRQKPDLLAAAINPGLNEIGVMLAYSPLHYLILKDFGLPVVATSGNLSGEPVLTDNKQAQTRLSRIADVFLQHNRPILRPADDSIIRIIKNKPRLFRIGRGFAPLEITLPFTLDKPTLAVGGQMKNTIALAWGDRLIISPHIGELDSKRSIEVFSQVIDDLCHLYRVKPEQIICDAHPDYYSSRYAVKYANKHQLPLTRIQHHKAHASIVWGEFDSTTSNKKPWLVFSWDGTGLGDDNTIWGGEGFYGHAGHWQRITSIKPFHLQGGDKAARQPWRSACALWWENNIDCSEYPSIFKFKSQSESEKMALAFQAWGKKINTIQCSSMGRLFDAASALLGLGSNSSFEGQGPLLLEAKASAAMTSEKMSSEASMNNIKATALPLKTEADMIIADWTGVLNTLLNSQVSIKQRALSFHQIIAETLIAQVKAVQLIKGDFNIGLSGGVFQNKVLTEYLFKRLEEEHLDVFLPEKVPYNDAGLSFGQIIEGASSYKKGTSNE